jgi:hypothetical protein
MNTTSSIRKRQNIIHSSSVLVKMLLEATTGWIKKLKVATATNATHLMVATTLRIASKQVMLSGWHSVQAAGVDFLEYRCGWDKTLTTGVTGNRRAVPWLRRLVACLSPRRPEFDPGSVHVGFVVDKVALGPVFLRVLRFSPVNLIPPVLH